ncbi:MAG TPA: OmpA family protein [Archangium sp.]
MTRILLAAVLVVSSLASAQEDCEGCKDHPGIARFPGFVLANVEQNDFNSVEFQIGEEKNVTKEGRYWKFQYELKEGARKPSCVEVLRNYENAFKKLGGKVEYRTPESCNGTLSMPLGKSQRWMSYGVVNGGELLSFDVVEVAAMQQKVEVDASEMLDALNKNGFIALYGVLFDTGKDAIKPESEPLLAEIAKLLTENADLKLSIEGHTDNVGNAKANQALSGKRADSVKKWLTGKGVDAKRLSTKGWGDTKPVADNRSEDGRAKNRRVELVKK